jgi:glycosyltransferase involved in cell wall biosynthesis
VLVVDAQSDDRTVEVAQAFGATVEIRPWEGFVTTRLYALSRVETPWTLMLDADEELDATARAALIALNTRTSAAGCRLARTTFFCGHAIVGCGWGGEHVLRLFRTKRARLNAHPSGGSTSELHEAWEVDGPVIDLPGRLLHHSYPTLESYRRKYAYYTAIEAAGLSFRLHALAREVLRALVRGPWLFIGRDGWRDSWRGVFICIASAWYPVVVQWKAKRE